MVGQLMQVAEHFVNWQSTANLPSSAQVLALLASNNADGCTLAPFWWRDQLQTVNLEL